MPFPVAHRRYALRRALIAPLLLVLLLSACGQQLQGAYHAVAPPPPPSFSPGMPAHNSPHTPSGSLTLVTSDNKSTNAVPHAFLNTTPTTTPTTRTSRSIEGQGNLRHEPDGIIVGTDAAPFLVGDRLGNLLPVLTRWDLRILAAPQPTLQGVPLHAEGYVRFDFGENNSGILRFGRDPRSGETRPELFFADGAPIFAYTYRLLEGAFPTMIGQHLAFFGHTYVIRDASNSSVTLYGLDTEQWLVLQNRSALGVNGDRIAATRVSVDPWSISITYYASDEDEGGLELTTGQSLRERFPRPDAFLNPIFDLRFEGLDDTPADLVTVTTGKRATLTFTDPLGEQVKLILASMVKNTLHLGASDTTLHVRECASLRDYCIRLHDEFLMARPEFTSVMEFTSVNRAGGEARFRDLTTGKEHLVRLAATGEEVGGAPVLDGAFHIDGRDFTVRILANGSASTASIDLDGSGGVHGTAPPLLTRSGVELGIERVNGSALRITLREPAITAPAQIDAETLSLPLTISDGAVRVGLDGIGLHQEQDTRVWQGVSRRGTVGTLERSVDGRFGEQVTLDYAPLFRSGIVKVIG